MTQTLEEVKERVNTLEYALGSFIIQTEKAIFSMSNEVQSLCREMKDFKDEMKEFKTTSKKNAKKKQRNGTENGESFLTSWEILLKILPRLVCKVS